MYYYYYNVYNVKVNNYMTIIIVLYIIICDYFITIKYVIYDESVENYDIAFYNNNRNNNNNNNIKIFSFYNLVML